MNSYFIKLTYNTSVHIQCESKQLAFELFGILHPLTLPILVNENYKVVETIIQHA